MLPDPRWLAGLQCATAINVATQGKAKAAPGDFMPGWTKPQVRQTPEEAMARVRAAAARANKARV